MIGQKIHRFKEVDSTNSVAFDLALKGAKEGEIVVAERQTQGRGRGGRSWESPAGRNIYMSVILRPPPSAENASCLTLVAGVATAEAIKDFSAGRLGLKWPNDVWLNGKKVCGILAERGDGFVIVGIGINVNSTLNDFSPEVAKIATSLALEDNGTPKDRQKIIKAVCREMGRHYKLFLNGGFGEIKRSYGFWSLIDGRIVEVIFGGERLRGISRGIDDDGALLLQEDEGETRRIVAGDVNLCS